jgi:hypothetical protein
VWTLLQESGPDDKWRQFLLDGVHLTWEGQRLVFEALNATVATQWPHFRSSVLQRPLPPPRQIDYRDPQFP